MSSYSFGNMGTVHMQVFIVFILTIVGLYIIWKLVIKQIL